MIVKNFYLWIIQCMSVKSWRLYRITYFSLYCVNERKFFYIRLIFSLQKQVQILIKDPISLFLYITKVCLNVFFLKSIPTMVAKFWSSFFKRINYSQPVCVIPIHKIVFFLTNSEARLGIGNFIYIDKVLVVVYMHM